MGSRGGTPLRQPTPAPRRLPAPATDSLAAIISVVLTAEQTAALLVGVPIGRVSNLVTHALAGQEDGTRKPLLRSRPLVCAQFLDRTGARPTDDYVSGAKQIEKR